jgi:hypothetical protein
MKNFKFDFSEKQINLILSGLGKLPAEISFELILEIQKLAQNQIAQKHLNQTENDSN